MSPKPTPPIPHTTLTITSRLKRRKFIVTRPTGVVAYYIVAPPSWAATEGNHHKTYLALLYRGDNPKYNSSSQLIGLVQRGTWWKTITHTLNGTVARDVKLLEKSRREKKLKKKNKVRKAVCMGEKTLEWEEGCELKEPVDEMGREVVMNHTAHRRYQVLVGDVEYRLSGTRMYSRNPVKGFALALKLVRVRDGALVATLDTQIGWGKKVGTLGLFVVGGGEGETEAAMDEQMVLQLIWGMAEAEYRKRDVVLQIILEILENADGG
ncbi:hypothetical protein K440DRAFT_140602 [Wilcoxina mikolae CBS 423.85]|nr:hypothetical protein K440DRAFT_140602 [Wilcoxina mikolae CBS 423.85]